MGWTNPKTWGVAETVDDVTMNLHVRDNLVYLKNVVDTLGDHGTLTGLADDDHIRYFDKDGSKDMTGVLKAIAGSVGAPGMTFVIDPDTGLYRVSADRYGLVAGGRLLLSGTKSDTNAGHTFYSADGTAYLTALIVDANYTYLSHGSSNVNSHFYIRNTTASGTLRLGTAGIDRWVIAAGGDLESIASNLKIPNTKNVLGLRDMYGGCLLDSSGLSAITARVGEFQWAGTVLSARARRIGGTGATVNAQVGTLDIRSADLSLTGTAWTDFGALQNAAIADGEDLDLQIATVTGAVTQIAIILEVARL